MPNTKDVSDHYSHGQLLDAIVNAVTETGKSIETITSADLAPVDEFHIGGRHATKSFLDQLQIQGSSRVLDVGCGIGGGCRFTAESYGCQVTGVDLTPEFVDTGNEICSWVSPDAAISLEVGDATSLTQSDNSFDCAYMMHVGMNIADKTLLAQELRRVIRPGGKLGVYDIMEMNEGELKFPVPWASDPSGSAVASLDEYKSALRSAGFEVTAERNRREFALEFFDKLKKKTGVDGLPPIGLHILMGESAPVKVKNMVENIARNLIAPVELIAERQE